MSRTSHLAVGLLALSLLPGTACGPFSPEAQEANVYLTDLQPLLVENGHLAEEVLTLSARVFNKDGKAESYADDWTGKIVPLAEHLHHQAQFVTPPAGWVDRHNELVDIWGDRAQVYRSLSEALVQADVNQWKTARKESTDVKLREENWFKEANLGLVGTGQSIDPTP